MRLSTLKKRLGDILVNVGLITEEQRSQALAIQKQNGGKLGTILAQMGAVNEEVMLAFLGKQCGISFISLREYGEIEKSVLCCLPEDLVRRRNLIPVAIDGNRITVAVSDPFDINAVDDIRMMTGYDVRIVIASEDDIRNAIDRNYRRLKSSGLPGVAMSGGNGAGTAVVSLKESDVIPVIFRHIAGAGATEILFEPQGGHYRVRYRVNNLLQAQYGLSDEGMAAFIHQLKAASGLGRRGLKGENFLTVNVDERDIAVQVTVMQTTAGERILMRCSGGNHVPADIRRLGFDPAMLSLYERSIEAGPGVIIVSGPRRSGRSTTFYATLSSLNRAERDIVAVDAGPAMAVPGISLSRPENGKDMSELIAAYTAQRPDILACGDIADRETAQMLFRAAFGGQSVIAAMTAVNAADALQRIRNFDVDHSFIASSLLLILNQRLMRMVCPACKVAYEVPPALLAGAGIKITQEGERCTLWRGTGCARCGGTGYVGVTAAYEMLLVDPRMRDLIQHEMPAEAIAAASRAFPPIQDAMWNKVRMGVSTVAEYLRLAHGQDRWEPALAS
jgi:type IV pilus assembly protein PilB